MKRCAAELIGTFVLVCSKKLRCKSASTKSIGRYLTRSRHEAPPRRSLRRIISQFRLTQNGADWESVYKGYSPASAPPDASQIALDAANPRDWPDLQTGPTNPLPLPSPRARDEAENEPASHRIMRRSQRADLCGLSRASAWRTFQDSTPQRGRIPHCLRSLSSRVSGRAQTQTHL